MGGFELSRGTHQVNQPLRKPLGSSPLENTAVLVTDQSGSPPSTSLAFVRATELQNSESLVEKPQISQ